MRAVLTATNAFEPPEAMWLLLTLTRSIPDGTNPRALSSHICAGTALTPAHICTRTARTESRSGRAGLEQMGP